MVESNSAVEEDKPEVEGDSNKELELVELSPDLSKLGVSIISKLMHSLYVLRELTVAGMLGIHFTEIRHFISELFDLAVAPFLFRRVAISLQVNLKLIEILHECSVEFV